MSTTEQAVTAAKPVVKSVKVTGSPDIKKSGVKVFKPVTVSVDTDHFTDDNLLTKEGLGWNNNTKVVPIKGKVTGTLNDPTYWGKNNPSKKMEAYSLEAGAKGRITNVGKTVAGSGLDLIYTIKSTDADKWTKNSGMQTDGHTKGIGFTGAQYIKGADTNSIATFYNGANFVNVLYQVVKHNTFQEMPILVSFITTDIDVGQGVKTNLDNLKRIIPEKSNLKTKNGVIYDASHNGPWGFGEDLSGASSLPLGGYLGVGFLSHFNYSFYAPAPANNDIYKYATGVRYDLFGSALQTKITVNKTTHLTMNFKTVTGNVLEKPVALVGYNSMPQVPKVPEFTNYKLTAAKVDNSVQDTKAISYTYSPITKVTVDFVDTTNHRLKDEVSQTGVYQDKYQIQPANINGYSLKETQGTNNGTYGLEDQKVTFVYQANPEQVVVKYVDQTNRNVSNSQVVKGLYNDNYQSKPVSVAGYTLKVTPKNANGIFSENNNDIVYVYQANPEQVVVKYVDQTNRNISNGQVVKGLYNDNYQSKPVSVAGYTLKVTPKNANGIFSENNNDVVYVYQANPEQVVVKYVDQTNHNISNSQVVKGLYNDNYQSKPVSVAGYKLKETPKNANGILSENNNDIVYVYQANPEQVVVRYVDQTNRNISNSQVVKGLYNDKYQSKPISVAGYKLKETPKNANGIFSENNNDIVYVYQANPEQLVVKYVDQTNRNIRNNQVVKGLYNGNYQSKPLSVAGYTLKLTPKNANGIFSENNGDVIYVYQANPEQVKVKYVNQNGNEISFQKMLNGTYGSRYQSTPVTVTGYKLKENPKNSVGTFGEINHEVVYVYQEIIGKIFVKYLNQENKEIQKQKLLTGRVGTKYVISNVEIKNYTLITNKKQLSGTFSKDNKFLKLIYKQNRVEITVNFFDKRHKKLTHTEKIIIPVSKKTKIIPKKIKGYSLPKLKVIQPKVNQTVDFVYSKEKHVAKKNKKVNYPKKKSNPRRKVAVYKKQGYYPRKTPKIVVRNVRQISKGRRISYRRVVSSNKRNIQRYKKYVNNRKAPKRYVTQVYRRPQYQGKRTVHTVQSSHKSSSSHHKKSSSKSSKHKSKAKRKIGWFERNTDLKPSEQKVIRRVLSKIAAYDRKHHKSKKQILLDQLYFMAYPGYKKDWKEKLTSSVGDYSDKKLQKILKNSNLTEKFEKFLAKQHGINGNEGYVDLSHMAITMASSMDNSLKSSYIKYLANSGKRVLNQNENWVEVNGFYGDWIQELGDISKGDLRADLDPLLNVKGDLNSRLNMYNQPTSKLDVLRNKVKNDTYKMAIFASMSVAGIALSAYELFKNRKKVAKLLSAKNIKKAFKSVKNAVVSKVKKATAAFRVVKQAVKRVKKTTHRVIKAVREGIRRFSRTIKRGYKKYVRPVYRKVRKTVKRIYRRYVKPVYRRIKRAVHHVYRRYVRPVYRRVKYYARRVYRRYIRPTYRRVRYYARRVYHRYVRPVYRRVRYYARRVYRRYVRPVYRRYIRPVYRRVYHYVRPVYHRVYRAVSQVYHRVYRAARRTYHRVRRAARRVLHRIGRFFRHWF